MTFSEALEWITKARGNAEALKMAKIALNKQVMMKPIRDRFYICPNCFGRLSGKDEPGFCPKCGQCLNWN